MRKIIRQLSQFSHLHNCGGGTRRNWLYIKHCMCSSECSAPDSDCMLYGTIPKASSVSYTVASPIYATDLLFAIHKGATTVALLVPTLPKIVVLLTKTFVMCVAQLYIYLCPFFPSMHCIITLPYPVDCSTAQNSCDDSINFVVYESTIYNLYDKGIC